jgi:hypothetical protein
MTDVEFRAWPKTPRLFKDVTITEKIDGTNGAIHVTEDGDVVAQSRKRLLSLDADNFGFARWVYDHSDTLRNILGVGTHFGEWWGHGINRGYGCEQGERYFSLFNVNKWGHLRYSSPLDSLSCVPVLWTGEMDTAAVLDVAEKLQINGSQAKPGFMRPEGVCLFHSASNSIYKYPFDKDDKPAPIAKADYWEVEMAPDPLPRPKTFKDKVKEMFWLMA